MPLHGSDFVRIMNSFKQVNGLPDLQFVFARREGGEISSEIYIIPFLLVWKGVDDFLKTSCK